MYVRNFNKYYRRIYKHEKFPFDKLQVDATGNRNLYTDEEKTLLVIAENMTEISHIVNYLRDS